MHPNPAKKQWSSVPQFPRAAYRVDVPWAMLPKYIAEEERNLGLRVEPDYQRGRVWTAAQKRAWVEHCLMGGETAKEVTLVCEHFAGVPSGRYAVADGLQRLTTAIGFVQGYVRVFPDDARPEGYALGDFDGKLSFIRHMLAFVTVVAPTRADELLLYLRINAGGTPHGPAELDRVRGLLRAEVAAGGAVTLGGPWVEFLGREAA